MNQEDKEKSKSANISISPLWVAGFLFTLGYVFTIKESEPWYMQLVGIAIVYLFWPLILGVALK